VTGPRSAAYSPTRVDDGFLGIDIGTSSVKALWRSGGDEQVTRAPYRGEQPGPADWMAAIREAVGGLRTGDTRPLRPAAVGLCGQTNTYVLARPGDDAPPVVPWSAGGGAAELTELLRLRSSFFVEHISMPHPAMVSYPAPRILWLKRGRAAALAGDARVMQPKDWVYLQLTGVAASDPFTWRGLACLGDGTFHREILDVLGLDAERLPALHAPTAAPGRLAAAAARALGVADGTPVVLGCNDFYASLAGMGTLAPGDWFDVAGSSEHVGRIESRPPGAVSTPLIYGPGLAHNVHYGVTAASGVSLDWGLRGFGPAAQAADPASAPLFLPYLQGERAPVFDPEARGVFFGLEKSHTAADLLYSICEGVAFSLRQIAALIDADAPATAQVRTSADGPLAGVVTQLKADAFGRPFVPVRQRACAALGAALFAAVGAGRFASLTQGAAAWVAREPAVEPRPAMRRLVEERFALFARLYPALKERFTELAAIREGP
jgi:xylulokinase